MGEFPHMIFLKKSVIAAASIAALYSAAFLPSAAIAQNDGTAATSGPIVVIITIDGFPARALQDPRLPMPTLRKLEAAGAHADAMMPVNPSVTWPNHTAIITGVPPTVHHVIGNGLLVFPPDGTAPKIMPWVPKDDLVHARTLYDAAADKGMTTGQVDWVAIYGAKNVRWEFGEKPSMDSPIAKELVAQNLVTADEVTNFGTKSSPARHDQIWTDAAIDILTHHTPNLMLIHLLETDTIQHAYGPLTPAAYAAYAYADSCITRVVEAIHAAGLQDRVTYILTSDHGFTNFTHAIHPNVALAERGLIKKDGDVWKGDVWFLPEGGETSLYIRDPAKRAKLVPELKAYFATLPGVTNVFTNEEAVQHGLPALGTTDQAPDLYITAKPGYAFSGGSEGPIETDLTGTHGGHGYLNTESDMQALFIASGAHIRAGIDLGSITNLRVAPTVAQILGVSLPDAKEKPLTEALQ
jgi:hypothetical protein